MGYENPYVSINQSNRVINQEINELNNRIDYEFSQANNRKREMLVQNAKAMEEAKAKREMGDKLWYQNVEKFRPKGGYKEHTEQLFKDAHEELYNIYDCMTPECMDRKQVLLGLPREASEIQGAQSTVKKSLDEARKKCDTCPGGVNYGQTENSTINSVDYAKNAKYTLDKNGHLQFTLYDDDGKQLGETTSSKEYTQGVLTGDIGVSTNGDPGAARKEIHKSILNEIGYNDLTNTLIDKRNPDNTTQTKVYDEANETAQTAWQNPKAYEKLFDDNDVMGKQWDMVVYGLMDQSKGGDENATKALGNILGNQDGTLDANEISEFEASGQAGVWQGNDVQKNAALSYYTFADPSENLLKVNDLEKQVLSNSSQPSYSEKTSRIRANTDAQKEDRLANGGSGGSGGSGNSGGSNVAEKDQFLANVDTYQDQMNNASGEEKKKLRKEQLDYLNSNDVSARLKVKGTGTSYNGVKFIYNKDNPNEVLAYDPKTKKRIEGAKYDLSKESERKRLNKDLGVEFTEPISVNLDEYNKTNKSSNISERASSPFDKLKSYNLDDKKKTEQVNKEQEPVIENKVKEVPTKTNVVQKEKPLVQASSNVESNQEEVIVKKKPTSTKLDSKTRYGHLVAQEDFGGKANSQGKATSLKGVYNEDQAKEYETSTKQLTNYAKNKPAFYGAEGNENRNPKKGLRTDVTPAIYDKLSDKSKMILQTEHFNMHWDPRVLLLQTAGMLGDYSRGQLHNDGDLLLKQWDSISSNPEELAKFNKAIAGKETQLLNNLEEIMKRTQGNQDQYKKRVAYLKKLM